MKRVSICGALEPSGSEPCALHGSAVQLTASGPSAYVVATPRPRPRPRSVRGRGGGRPAAP